MVLTDDQRALQETARRFARERLLPDYQKREKLGVLDIVPSVILLDEARALARQMLTGVPEALVAYKRLLNQEAASSFDDALRIERSASMANNTLVPREQI